MLYKGGKSVNVAARPPKGGPAEPGSLSALSLPLLDSTPFGQIQQKINAASLNARVHMRASVYIVASKTKGQNFKILYLLEITTVKSWNFDNW